MCVAGPGIYVRIDRAAGSHTDDIMKEKMREGKRSRKDNKAPLSILSAKKSSESSESRRLYTLPGT